MNGDVFTTSFQNAILLKKFVKTQIATSRSYIMLLLIICQIVTFQIDELFSN